MSQFDYSSFPIQAYTSDKQLQDLNREERLRYRSSLFLHFLDKTPQGHERFAQMPKEQKALALSEFEQYATDQNPDFFSVQIAPARTEKIDVSLPYDPMGPGTTMRREVDLPERRSRLRDHETERYYDFFKEGIIDVEDVDWETASYFQGLLLERGEEEKAKEFQQRIIKEAEDRGLTKGQAVRSGLFRGAIGAPLEQFRQARQLMPTGRLHSELMYGTGARLPKEPTEDELLRRTAYPVEQTSEIVGALGGIIGTSVGGYASLANAGMRSIFTRVPGAARYRLDPQALSAFAAMEGGIGLAYADVAPGVVAEILQMPDNYLLTGIEAAAIGSIFNLGVDLIRGLKGANPSRLNKTLKDNLPPEKFRAIEYAVSLLTAQRKGAKGSLKAVDPTTGTRAGTQPLEGVPSGMETPPRRVGSQEAGDSILDSSNTRSAQEASQEVELAGVHQATNPEGESVGRVMNQHPSSKPLDAGVPEAQNTVRANAATPDNKSKIGLVPDDYPKVQEFIRQIKNLLIKGGSIPKPLFKELEQARANVRSIIKRSEFLLNDMNKAIKTLPSAERTQSRALLLEALEGRLPFEELPLPLREPAKSLRNEVDDLSRRILQKDMVSDELAETIGDGVGSYLSRTFKAHTDPDWARKIPQQDYDDAVEYIRLNWNRDRLDKAFQKRMDRYQSDLDSWEKAAERAFREGKEPPAKPVKPWRRADYQGQSLTIEEASRIANDIIDPIRGQQFLMGQTKMAGKDVGVLMRRQEIPFEIRRLLGEITDPLEKVALTINRQANLIENHIAQENMRRIGLELGIFQEGPSPLFRAHMGSEGVPSRFDVMSGIYTRKDIYEDITQAMRGARSDSLNWPSVIDAVYTRGVGVAKITKTLFNFPNGYVTNYLGAIGNELTQGSINPANYYRGVVTTLENNYGVGDKAYRGLLEKLVKYNLLDQNYGFRDLKASLGIMDEAKGPMGKSVERLGELWSMGDDITKVMAWLSEESRYSFLRTNMSPDDFDSFIAGRVSATRQMYDRVPKWMRELSKREIGIIPFVAFNYDQGRILVNTVRTIIEDFALAGRALANGDTALASGYTKAASKRLAGFMAFGIGGGEAARRQINSRNDVSEEDAEMARIWLPPFFQQETFALRSNPHQTGQVRPQILSYNFPNENWWKLFRVGYRALKDPDYDAESEILGVVMDNFIGGGLYRSTLMEAVTGTDQYGNEIVGGAIDRVGYLARNAFDPGMVIQIRQISDAIQGTERRFGVVPSVEDRVNHMLGQRVYTYDIRKAMPDKFWSEWNVYREAERQYRRAARRSPEDSATTREWQKRNEARRMAFVRMQKMVESAQYFGIPESEIRGVLRRELNMSNQNINQITRGRYEDLPLPQEFLIE